MQRYDAIGKKRANFSFATGTPDIRPGHPDDIWPHLLPAVRHARDHGHDLALHEYMGPEADWGVGRRQVDVHRKHIPDAWHGRRDARGNPDESYPYYVFAPALSLHLLFLPASRGWPTRCCSLPSAVATALTRSPPTTWRPGRGSACAMAFGCAVGATRTPLRWDAAMVRPTVARRRVRRRRDDLHRRRGARHEMGRLEYCRTGVEMRVLAYIAAERNTPDRPIPDPAATTPAPVAPSPSYHPHLNRPRRNR